MSKVNNVHAEIRNYTKQSVPSTSLKKIAREILPDKYELSIACVGAERARNANQQYRKKSYVPNVLSFPLSKKSGEVLLSPACIYKEADGLGISRKEYLIFLFIHSLLHLLGHKHGDIMEKKELSLCKKYGISMPTL